MKIKKYFFGIIALIVLTLLTGLAAAENVTDTLDELENKIYPLDGIDHDVTVTDIGTSKVNFTIDGEMSDPLEEGDFFKFPSHVEIEVITINDAVSPYNVTFNLETLDRDFSVVSVSITDPVVVGENAYLQITLLNSGDDAAVNVNLTIDKGDGSAYISMLVTLNATTPFTYDAFGPIVYSSPSDPDPYDLTVYIDYDLAVPETDETNNNKTIEVDVEDPDYNMTVEDAVITVIAGKSNTGTFEIDNTGNMDLEGIGIDLATDLIYTEDISITIPKTAISFVPNPANTSVGRSREITVTVDIPKDATAVTYEAEITADHIDVPTTKTSTLTVVVEARDEVVELTEMPSYVFVEGFTAIKTENFKITNNGNVDLVSLTYEITDLVGPSASITEVDITNVGTSIPEGSYDLATLSVKVTGQPEGDYTGTITVKEAGVEIHQEVVTVKIDPKDEVLSASIGTIDLVKIDGYSDEVNLTVTNDGNALLRNIEVKIEDLIKDSSNSITTSHITNDEFTISTLEPGKSYIKTIKVTLPSTDLAIGNYFSVVNISYAGKSEIVTFQASVSDVENDLTPNKDIIVSGEREETVSTTFTLENTGDETLTIIDITSLNIDLDYNVSITLPSDKVLSVGEVSGDITVELYIPESADSGDTTIGNMLIETDKMNKTLPIIIRTESKLSFRDVDIEVDGDSESVDNGEEIDEVKPGSIVKVLVRVENEYTDSENIDIEDIEIEAVIKNIDDDGDDDLEETSDSFDLDADDYSDEYELEFEIPLDVDEDTYDLEIEAEGEDENGIKHSVKWVIKLKVEKEKDDVRISRADIFPDVLECNRRGSIEIKIINMGSNDMDDVYLEATSSSLGLSKKTSEFDIDEGDSKTKTIEFDVSDKPAGTYTISVELFDDDDDELDGTTIEVIVQDCGDFDDIIIDDDDLPTGTTADDITSSLNIIGAGKVEEDTEVTESKFIGSGSYIALLVLMNVIVIGVVAYLFVAHLAKPKV